jgi:hypothetical protein
VAAKCRAIGDVSDGHRSLCELDLTGAGHWTDASWDAVLAAVGSGQVTSLVLAHRPLGSVASDGLPATDAGGRLHRLLGAIEASAAGGGALRELDLTYCGLDDGDGVLLGKTLATAAFAPASRLEALYLGHNRLGPESVRALSPTFSAGGLRILQLDGNPLGDRGVAVLVEAFAMGRSGRGTHAADEDHLGAGSTEPLEMTRAALLGDAWAAHPMLTGDREQTTSPAPRAVGETDLAAAEAAVGVAAARLTLGAFPQGAAWRGLEVLGLVAVGCGPSGAALLASAVGSAAEDGTTRSISDPSSDLEGTSDFETGHVRGALFGLRSLDLTGNGISDEFAAAFAPHEATAITAYRL